jgi:hypothetical protein
LALTLRCQRPTPRPDQVRISSLATASFARLRVSFFLKFRKLVRMPLRLASLRAGCQAWCVPTWTLSPAHTPLHGVNVRHRFPPLSPGREVRRERVRRCQRRGTIDDLSSTWVSTHRLQSLYKCPCLDRDKHARIYSLRTKTFAPHTERDLRWRAVRGD